ncbi:hypothetical protein BKI52_17495 [marine bacterium AO1-C]|nr:hypothetical protein BKI52_17495 [marine bacterium AO1-C]
MKVINNPWHHAKSWLPTSLTLCFLLTLLTQMGFSQKYDPGAGKTLLLIGQTFQSEYQNYAQGVGTKPAGSSHYGSIYLGAIEQGDDDPNAVFLDWVRNYQANPYALIALSIKDNTAAGNYGQMISPDWDQFNPNAVHDALVAINNGEWDARIDQFGDTFASRPDVKFFVRIGYEVSLLLFAYKGEQYVNDWLNQQADQGINVFENPDNIANLDRQAYINAYNRIANRIRAKASNVVFVYHPVRGLNDTKWLYPGDANVDYVGFSIFNNDVCLEVNGTFNCEGQSVDPELQASMDFAKAHNKPIIIAEAAAQAPATGSVAAFKTYLNKLHQVIVNNDVRLLAYINSNWPIHGWDANWGDSRVEVNAEVKEHWKSIYVGGRYIQGDGSSTGGGGEDAPATPSNLQASANSSSQIVLTWSDNANNESGFYIERNAGVGFVQIASVGANTTTFSDNDLSAATTYQYRVRAHNASGNSGYSNQASATTNTGGGSGDCAADCPSGYNYYLCGQCWVSEAQARSAGCTETCDGGNNTTPNVPTGLSASVVSASQINLAWSDNSDNEQGFYIERATSAGGFTQVASVGAGVTFYSDNGLSASTTYQYRVRAYNASGNSGYSSQASATTNTGGGSGDCAADCPSGYNYYLCGQCWVSEAQARSAGCTETCDGGNDTTPAAPTGLSVSAVSDFQINLTWNDNSDNEQGFYIERATGSGAFTQIASVASGVTSYSNSGLLASTTYRYRVRAYNSVGNSDYSNEANATTTNNNPSHCNNNVQDGDETGVDCGGSCVPCSTGDKVEGKLTPKNGKTLLVIGQDLKSVFDYTQSGYFQAPGGVTTYLAFHSLLDPNNPQYGALGENPGGTPTNVDIDWGAGPLNAHKAAFGYSGSALVLGINFANGNQFETWFPTGVQDIGAGLKSAEIKRLADFCKSVSKPVYIRLGYEFDGTWNNYVSPQAYVAAFREIVRGVRAEGANNVAFVWQSSAYPPLGFPDLNAWYPGDEYVDWCGFSWFLAPNFGVSPTSAQLADAMLAFARQHNKPVMIAESSPQGYDLEAGTRRNINSGLDGPAGGNTRSKTGIQIWDEWFKPYFDYIHQHDDIIRAVAYINADWDAQPKWQSPYPEGYWGDTRVETNAVIRDRWLTEVNTSFWLQGSTNISDEIFTNGGQTARQTQYWLLDSPNVVLLPNPTNSQTLVKIKGVSGNASYTVLGVTGVEVARGKMSTVKKTLDIKGLKPGVYFVKIINGDQQIVKRLIIK